MGKHKSVDQLIALKEKEIALLKKRKRSQRNQRLILLGAAVEKEFYNNEEFQHLIESVCVRNLTKKDGARLQALYNLENADNAEEFDSEAAPEPVLNPVAAPVQPVLNADVNPFEVPVINQPGGVKYY